MDCSIASSTMFQPVYKEKFSPYELLLKHIVPSEQDPCHVMVDELVRHFFFWWPRYPRSYENIPCSENPCLVFRFNQTSIIHGYSWNPSSMDIHIPSTKSMRYLTMMIWKLIGRRCYGTAHPNNMFMLPQTINKNNAKSIINNSMHTS